MHDEMPYRTSGFVPQIGKATVPLQDEADFSTLKAVHEAFVLALDGLYKDFNTFTIGKDKLPADRAKLLLYDVEIKQGVYDVLLPLITEVEEAMNLVDNKYKDKR